MKVYQRTENGVTATVPQKTGLEEINHAMMGGRRDVKEMSSITRTDYAIQYRDGRDVRLVLVDAAETETDADTEWAGTHSRFNNLHRFNNGRARCNSRIRPLVGPVAGQKEWAVTFHSRAEIENSGRTDVYSFCPRCEKK